MSLFFYIMDNLVFINESNDVLTDSLRVAVKFEKDHSKVIRSIDDLLEKSYVIDTECNPKMIYIKCFVYAMMTYLNLMVDLENPKDM